MSAGIQEARNQVRQLNVELRIFNKLANEGNVSTRDLLVFARLFGGPEIGAVVANMQIAIATANALRTTLKLLQLEMGPIGWALLAIGTFAGLAATQQMDARRPRY